MKRLGSRFTYANVISTLALFLVLAGGTAFATSQFEKESIGSRALKKEAVTPLKLSKRSKETLTGAAGPKGATGAQGSQGPKGATGAAGSAVAYARVAENGTLDTEHSKNITSSSLSANTGVYCITPSVPVTSVVATTPHVGGDPGVVAQANILANGDTNTLACTSPVWVSTWKTGGGLENHPFYLVFN